MKFMTYTAALFATIAGASSAADDGDWIEIANSKTDKMSVDPGTIKLVSGPVRSAWFQFKKIGNPASGTPILSKEFVRINCDEESVASVSNVSYKANGEVFRSHTTPIVLLSFEPAPPGTLASKMVQIVCKFNLD